MIPNFIKNLGFRKKIFVICMLVSLVPVAILGTFCYRQIRTLLSDRERTALNDSLMQESNTLQTQFNGYENVMDYVIWNENIKQALNQIYDSNFNMYIAYRDTLDPLFKTMKSLNHNIKDITIYTDLNIHPHGTTLRPLTEIEDTQWYPMACTNYKSIWISSMEQQELFLIRQMYDIQGNHTAIVKVDIYYDSTFSFLETLYEDSYGILLADQNGMPIYQFHTKDMQDNMLKPQQLAKASRDNNNQSEYIIEEVSDIFNDWSLYLYRPVNTVSVSAQAITHTTLIIILVCLVCVILLSSFLSSTIVRPLENLTANMQQVEQGVFAVTVIYDSSDEIGRLIKSFQSMVQQMNHLINEILKGKITHQEYELRALQAQIKPHFLYNALSLINSRAILTGQKEIEQMAQFLSTFYRTTLNKGKSTISVRDELKNVRSYVNIQLLMHSNSFDVTYHIQEEILSLTMINLLLQPLVENAIIHGIDHTPESRRGLLEITGYQTEDELIFQISDNGPGIPGTKLLHILNADSEGYGIQNVHNRVQLFYGVQYGLSYQSQPDYGTTVTLCLSKKIPENKPIPSLIPPPYR